MFLPLRKALERLNVAPLKFFARELGLSKKLKRKGELIDALANEMEVNLQGVWRELSETEQRVLAEVAHNGGSYDSSVYKAKYSEWCPTQEPEAWSEEASLVWLFCSMQLGRYVMLETLVDRIKAPAPKPLPPGISTLEEIPKEIPDEKFGTRVVHVHWGNDFSVMELGSVLSLIKTSPIKVNVGTLRPAGHAEYRLPDALIDFDFSIQILRNAETSLHSTQQPGSIRPHAWAVLVQQCGWCKPAGETLQLTDRGAKMLYDKDIEEFRGGVRRFIENDEFDELDRIKGVEASSHYGKRFLTRPSERRRAIWESMKSWPRDRWISVQEVFRFLVASESGFSAYGEPYRASLGLGTQTETFYSGEYIDRLYVRTFLFESLGTLGLLDLGYVHPANLWPDLLLD